jgi:16S rRNA (cytidine1402-2'-O)-methyltransferase
MQAGTLYIVATPIGNLGDITLRALEVIKSSDYLLAEDTRVSRHITDHYDIQVSILIYNQHSSDSAKEKIYALLKNGKKISLLTDAGTPGISDPGNELIAYILKKDPDLKVVPIPGASALTAALSVSGFRVDKLLFIGFLPKKGKTKLFDWIKKGKINFCYFESPYRIIKSLVEIENHFGKDVQVCVCRELTKKFETIYRGKVGLVAEKLKKDKIKGEFVVVVDAIKSW